MQYPTNQIQGSPELAALDIETKCNVSGCQEAPCKHALYPATSIITVIGVYHPEYQLTFRTLDQLKLYLIAFPHVTFITHGGKFDFKHLAYHGLDISSRWSNDTQLMASACLQKIPKEYLEAYEAQRRIENKKLPHGYSHREVKGYSLKTLAPFFLNIPAFWEDPTNHDSDIYVLKDCEYTYKLYESLLNEMQQDGTYSFYKSLLFPATTMLLRAEMRGIKLDISLLHRLERETELKITDIKTNLDIEWDGAYRLYYEEQRHQLQKEYLSKQALAYEKSKDKSEAQFLKIAERYEKLFLKALPKLERQINLDSPKQMAWLLRDHFKLNIEREVRDKETNIIEIKDSTGTEILQKLVNQTNRKDLRLLLDYRENHKLLTSFFQPYKQMHSNGVIHATLNPTGTRTGRLSSSDPNLQQVPGHLHQLFIARPGYKIASFDESAIEARLLAYYSEDPVLFDLVLNDKDIHGFHTCLFFNLDCDPSEVKAKHKEKRQITKNVGFGLFYGAGYKRIKQEAIASGYDWSDKECREKTDHFKETYQQIYRFKRQIDEDRLEGPGVNLFGRKFSFPNPDDIYMQNLNTLIQSSASDLVFFSAYQIQREFDEKGIDAHILLLVHDEIVTEIPEDREEECVEIIKRNMTNYELKTRLGVMPLAVEGKVEKSWSK